MVARNLSKKRDQCINYPIMNKINAVYFSCGRDEEMLALSVDSILKNYEFNDIILASDPNDPVKNIPKGITKTIVREAGSEKLYGEENIKSMHKILDVASYGCDYVQKIDSDVICCSPYAYDQLNENDWDAYGGFPMARKELIPECHFAGSSYFIRSSFARKLSKKERFFKEARELWGVMNMPEDMVTSFLLTRMGCSVKVDGTEMTDSGRFCFDSALSKNTMLIGHEEMIKYGFAHCRTNKYITEYIYGELYGTKPE